MCFSLQACVAVLWMSIILPPEVLTKIFSYLPQRDLLTTIKTVCHYWNEVAFSSSLWKTIDVICSTDDELDIYLQNIAHYKDFVQNLLIKSAHQMKFFDSRKNRNLSNLRNLEITNHQLEDFKFYKSISDLTPGVLAIEFSISKSADTFGCLSVLRDFAIPICKKRIQLR